MFAFLLENHILYEYAQYLYVFCEPLTSSPRMLLQYDPPKHSYQGVRELLDTFTS